MKASESQPTLPRVLVVDDQPLNIQALHAILDGEYDVFMATNAADALEVCAETALDVILLDVVMPDVGGHELCRRLKRNAHTQDIPVIFVTAHDSPEQEALGLEVGAVDFISKPLNAPVVRARVRTHATLKRQGDLLRQQARLDGLTGIPNRRHFDETLALEWRACQRNSAPLSLVMLDVDHFKAYNDRYGHLQGDVCLRSIARTIHASLARAHDLAARYGGEEFACVLPNCPLDAAVQLAENIRLAVLSLQLEHSESADPGKVVTVSAGVASEIPNAMQEWLPLVAIADQRLYAAKDAGRNRVRGA